MDQELLRKKLIEVANMGFKVKSIAEKTDINIMDLSRFKNGHIYLKKDDAEILNKFLNQVHSCIS